MQCPSTIAPVPNQYVFWWCLVSVTLRRRVKAEVNNNVIVILMIIVGIISGTVHHPEFSKLSVLETGSVSLVRYGGGKFPTLIKKKNAVFWDVAPCRSCVSRRFGGTYRLHLQGRKIRARGISVSRWLQAAETVSYAGTQHMQSYETHYLVRKSLPLVPILSQINPVYNK
jgi:hypothetical protein